MDDAELEMRIDAAYFSFCAASRRDRRAAWEKVEELVRQRSERRVRVMEQKQGIQPVVCDE